MIIINLLISQYNLQWLLEVHDQTKWATHIFLWNLWASLLWNQEWKPKSKGKLTEIFKLEVRKIAQIKSFVQSIAQIYDSEFALFNNWTKKNLKMRILREEKLQS